MDRIKLQDEETRKTLASNYKDFINDLGLFDGYLKTSEITKKIGARNFRKVVEDVLFLFSYGYLDFMIISNQSGYKASNSLEEIEHYLKAKRNQFISLSKNYSTLKKAMQHRINFNIEEV